MNKENINRLKKYLFLISIFFASLIWSHIIYVYLFYNSIEKPIEWWSISEWVIWEFPHLNPLKYSNDYNKNIIYLLYNSLLKYDFNSNSIIWDLASCDLKDLSYIECNLNSAKWSDWTLITTDDVISTYNIIKNSDINPYVSGLLKNTKIKVINNVIIFQSTVKDINIINAFYQPIVSKNIIDNIWNKELFWNFNPIGWLYSWPYKIENISYDDSLWIQKLFLIKNENFKPLFKEHKIYISKYVFKFFKDINHFNKHKDTINIFHDNNYNLLDISPRIKTFLFNSNQYLSLIINKEKITNNELRKFLLNIIDREKISTKLWNWYSNIYNPYLLGEKDTIEKLKNSNIESLLKKQWYLKKDTLAENKIKSQKENYFNEIQDKYNKKIKLFDSWVKNFYTFTDKDVLTLKWNLWNNDFDEIYVNDARLDINKKTKHYSYTLSLDNKNLNKWENKYQIFTKKNKEEKKLAEEFIVIFEEDSKKLDEIKNKLILSKATNEEIKTYENKIKSIEEKLSKIDNNFYYNEKLEPFELRFYYIEWKNDTLAVSNLIKNIIETYWIKVNAVPISNQDLTKKVQENKKDYDLILVWIDLWITNNNIFPYFHSSQANSWFNLSNIKNSKLDDILEKLKSQVLNEKETTELKNQALDIFKKENIVKTLYNRNQVIYYDKNINNLVLDKNISNILAFYEKLKSANIIFEKSIKFENKWVFDFLNFIKKVFKNDSELER